MLSLNVAVQVERFTIVTGHTFLPTQLLISNAANTFDLHLIWLIDTANASLTEHGAPKDPSTALPVIHNAKIFPMYSF
jgi:hypothetical protein